VVLWAEKNKKKEDLQENVYVKKKERGERISLAFVGGGRKKGASSVGASRGDRRKLVP